jgi:general stress protein YciG
MTEPTKTSKPRGFAAISPERRREIASMGGLSVPAEKRSFSQDRDLASRSGSTGGKISRGGGRPRKVPVA